ncbi:hypothetical protein [Microbulbifer sp. 2205BS26-8]|uniref:hypothetical protein n=1 Tax=Microbulbifer sp. 2205BS26-8 TaxID=3064386 RepID=UPI00273EE08E|nr:hypothetical protein [Microbulbifer sp. 2205BS26-8]MDP5210542.1 hypothetical protein [Microbulbifer sp. 2205BS26-8]
MAVDKKYISLLFPPRLRGLWLLPLFLAACASDGPMPGAKESFHTEIAPNGAKRFVFTLEREHKSFPAPVLAHPDGQRRMQRGPVGAGAGVSRRDIAYFERALARQLAETGFCKQGYFEIERTVYKYGGEVRGECREGAGE